MAKFKTSINLTDAVKRMQELQNRPVYPFPSEGEFFVVVEAFNFNRDMNGNTINKYSARLHRGDLVSVQNNYTGVHSIEILTSPFRREQSHNEGQSAALYWLEKIGYDLEYVSMTDETKSVYRGTNNAYVRYRHVYRVTNKFLKA